MGIPRARFLLLASSGLIAAVALGLLLHGRHADQQGHPLYYTDCFSPCRDDLARLRPEKDDEVVLRVAYREGWSVDAPHSTRVRLHLEGVERRSGSAEGQRFAITDPLHELRLEFDPPVAVEDVGAITIKLRSHKQPLRGGWVGIYSAAGRRRIHPLSFASSGRVGFALLGHTLAGDVAAIGLRLVVPSAAMALNEIDVSEIAFWRGAPLGTVARHLRPGDRVKLGNETRPAMLALAGQECRCRVRLESPAVLDMDFGRFDEVTGPPLAVCVDVERDGRRRALVRVDAAGAASGANDRGWQSERVAIDEPPGDVDLIFRWGMGDRCGHASRSGLAAGLWSNLDVRQASPEPSPQRSVVLISLDTLRADRLGIYGYHRPTSPAIDALARGGLVFEQAIAQANQTLWSHGSLFSGMYPASLPGDPPALVEQFREAGYRTGAFTENAYVGSALGFDRGFQSYHDGAVGAPRGEKRVEATVAQAREWLARFGDGPFFLFVHTYETHTPYHPPAAVEAQFVGDYSGPYQAPFPGTGNLLWDLALDESFTEEDLKFVSDLYDAGVRHLDEQLAALLVDLDAREDVIVAVFSDHGEDLGDHVFVGHGHTLYEEIVRVPLILAGGGIAPGRVRGQVEVRELMPALLELAGVGRAETFGPTGGIVAAVRGVTASPGVAFSEAFDGQLAVRAEVDGVPYKLIHRPAAAQGASAQRLRETLDIPSLDGMLVEWELFDLAADPGEKDNLFDVRPAVAAELRRRMDVHLRQPRSRAGVGSELDSETRERLRALGYTDDAPALR